MKFECGKTERLKAEAEQAYLRELYQDRKKEKGWEKVFLWRMTRVGFEDCRWLEYVMRRPSVGSFTWEFYISHYEYKPLDKK